MNGLILSVTFMLCLTACQAPPRPAAPPAALPAPPGNATNVPALQALGSGRFQLGRVRLDQAKRTVSFPAVLNSGSGTMEYFLVTTYGKTHESILRTEVPPVQVQLALVLLHAKGADTSSLRRAPNEYGGTPEFAITGDPVTIEVAWEQHGKTIHRLAEAMFVHLGGAGTEPKGRWVFNGSVVWQGAFLAQSSGSLISLIPDPIALVNLSPARGESVTWTADPERTPPPGVLVQVTISLVAAGATPERPRGLKPGVDHP